ncbi:HNH endonuclease [Mesorhizobium ciceri]|uniref:HNH endonuclease n=1 Tax=Mesorhizobium TaxID=68287 RepID=UPI00047B0441|nr:HNH endonuclease signature motif containing protein [Mesorhizobium ciceri]
MWLLDKPSVRSVRKQLDTALTLVNGDAVYALSAAERTAIAAAYTLYDREQGRAHADLLTCGLTTPCLTALYRAYNEVQKGGRLKGLRRSLLDSAETCPLCGFAEPTQLDHFLPRDQYRGLSIYPRNLVPACGSCNNVKRTHVGAGDDELVHAYFDELPDEDFLVADITMTGTALVATFIINPVGIDPVLAARLQFQLERMQLNQRYPKQINIFLFGQRTGMLQVYAAGGGTALRAFLVAAAADLDRDFEKHDWRAALMRGLADCNAFCDGGITAYFARRPRRRRAAV